MRIPLPSIARTLPAALLALAALQAPISQAAPLDQPLSDAQFAACVRGLAQETRQSGRALGSQDFSRIAGQARYDDRVRQALRAQKSEPTLWWDDIAATTDDERVAQGREVLQREADALRRIEARWGVPREIVVAIYGIETNYGPAAGRIPVLDAALSLACLRPCTGNRCAARERAYAAVRLLRDGRVRPDNYQGSWAAAFGRTQFVPDTFEQIAVDFDGDGVADIVGSEHDAFASTANHLRTRGGWLAGAPVYVEVTIPQAQHGQLAKASGRVKGRERKLSEWAALGWQAVGAGGQALPLQAPGDPQATPFLPVGLPGPAFLVTRNFNTIWRYNNSERYVMEVAVLANRLAGGPGIVTPWPTDDPGLSRAQVRQLQAWLQQRGHALVQPDGIVGRNTRDAIEAERARKGLPAGRRVGQRTLGLLLQP